MSEKRFVLEISSFSGKYMKFLNILDNGKRLKSEDIVDLLNEQQATITALKEENKQLKEQLQMIERIIQTQITEKEEDLRTSVKGGMPTGGLYSEIEFLKKLKKECFDE